MVIRTFSNEFLPLPVYPITFCAHHSQERINRPNGFLDIAQLLFVLEGEGILLCNGRQYSLRAGSAFFLDCGTAHAYGGEAGLVTAWVTFRGSGLNEIRRYVGQKGFILIEHANTERAVESIEQMEREYFTHRREGVLSSLTYQLLMNFIEGRAKQSETDMQRVIRYMEASFDQQITVDQLASMCHISKSSFCQRFKEAFECTAFEKLMEIRLLNAELRLMLYPDEMIGSIAKQCGFDDVGYFCKCFKKRFGTPPSRYRLHSAALRTNAGEK